MHTRQTAIAQRNSGKRFFDHQDMDYYLSWVLGRVIYEGSAADECMAAAAQITNGDADSWVRAWCMLAQRVEDLAHAARANGERALARSAFLRACTYYRAPLFLMSPHTPAFHDTAQKMRHCFQEALPFFDSPIAPITVPFGDATLYGYLWTPDPSQQQRPTLIVVGGIETFAEDCYFITGLTGPERGYTVLAVDLPGQGTAPNDGLFFGARMERPLAAVIDYALGRPEVDADRLAVFGFSWGGHIVCKGGQHDRRIKALVANPAMPNVFRAVLGQQRGQNRSDPIAKLVFAQIAWRMGLRISLAPSALVRRIAKAYDYLVYGRTDPHQIRCPMLCLAGEAEAPITRSIAHETYARLPHPQKKLVIFTAAQGGAAHCQIDNLALPNRVIFDWLDTVLE